MGVDGATARAKAEAVIATWPFPESEEEQVVVWDVEEHSRAWVVRFATRRWLRTRDMHDMLVGSCPFVVEKDSGDVHLYGSGEFAKFDEWLDD